jgi:cyclopropane fatty-acyl-phospholipid synthase-like methyltransferase
MRPGDKVLDIGSGCGHKLTMLTEWFGVQGYGVEYTPANVDYSSVVAQTNKLPLQYCLANAKNLGFLPSEGFEHAVTVALPNYFSFEESCALFDEVHRTLKPGGQLLVGWNHWPKTAYADCPTVAQGKFSVTEVRERLFLGSCQYTVWQIEDSDDGAAPVRHQAYWLVLTKR